LTLAEKPPATRAKPRPAGPGSSSVLKDWIDNKGNSPRNTNVEPTMDVNACIEYLCGQQPPITDGGMAFMEWKKAKAGGPEDSDVLSCIDTVRNQGNLESWSSKLGCQYKLKQSNPNTPPPGLLCLL
jgi:hypothetical protein